MFIDFSFGNQLLLVGLSEQYSVSTITIYLWATAHYLLLEIASSHASHVLLELAKAKMARCLHTKVGDPQKNHTFFKKNENFCLKICVFFFFFYLCSGKGFAKM